MLQAAQAEHLKSGNVFELMGLMKEQPAAGGMTGANADDARRRRRSRAESNWRSSGTGANSADSSDDEEEDEDEGSSASGSGSETESSADDANQTPLWG